MGYARLERRNKSGRWHVSLGGGSLEVVCLMIAKIFKYVGIAIAGGIVVLVSSALLYRKYLQHEVAQERAITSPQAEERKAM